MADMTSPRPASIPEGLVVELSRCKVLPGAGGEADRCMKMLDDRDHVEQAKRTKEPGWVEAEPQVLMLPDPVRRAVLDWALRPADSA
jgi:hypothetical protein